MNNDSQPTREDEQSMDALLLQAKTEKYKLAYATIRWAKEIKQKENLPDSVQSLVPRALREILGGKASIAEIEELPMAVKVAPPPVPIGPTITLNPLPDDTDDEVEAKRKASAPKE